MPEPQVERLNLTQEELQLAAKATQGVEPATTKVGLTHVVSPDPTPLHVTWRSGDRQDGRVIHRGEILDPQDEGETLTAPFTLTNEELHLVALVMSKAPDDVNVVISKTSDDPRTLTVTWEAEGGQQSATISQGHIIDTPADGDE
jgi:hypothetical protein